MPMSAEHPKILVTGANGQVGWELMRRAEKFGVTAVGTERAELDITDVSAVDAVITPGAFDVVVNAASGAAGGGAGAGPGGAGAGGRGGAARRAAAGARAV